jgi:hypothetical protein
MPSNAPLTPWKLYHAQMDWEAMIISLFFNVHHNFQNINPGIVFSNKKPRKLALCRYIGNQN